MYVCLCRGVTDRNIRAAIEGGAGTVEEVGLRTGAGTECGECRRAIEELIRAAGAHGRADLSAGGASKNASKKGES